VAPVELIGFRRTKTQWDTGCTRGVPMLFGPAPEVTALKILPRNQIFKQNQW
jgi:hypothetical protein